MGRLIEIILSVKRISLHLIQKFIGQMGVANKPVDIGENLSER